MIKFILQDWKANCSNPTKGKYVVVLFRFAQFVKGNRFLFYLFIWYLFLYRIIVEWFMCIELSWHTEIGAGLQIYHGSGLVIHPNSKIGENCRIRQCTTIGIKQSVSNSYDTGAPSIGNNVDIGCNSVIIGDIVIGDNTIIGAGSIVIRDLPKYCIAVGNPARIVKYINNKSE